MLRFLFRLMSRTKNFANYRQLCGRLIPKTKLFFSKTKFSSNLKRQITVLRTKNEQLKAQSFRGFLAVCMSKMVLLLIYVMLVLFIRIAVGINSAFKEETTIFIRSVQCNVSEKFSFQNFTCFAKSYSRTVSTVNVFGMAKIPLNKIHVNYCFFLIFLYLLLNSTLFR